MRIALFLPSLDGGGAERINLLLATGFLQKGAQVDLVLARAQGPYLEMVPRGVNLIDLRASRVLTSFPALVSYLKRENPFVLLSSLSHANVVAVWAREVARVPTKVLVAEHVPLKASYRNKHLRLNEQMVRSLMGGAYRRAEAVIAVSRGLGRELVEGFGLPKDKIRVIYNPVIQDELFEKAKEPVEHPWLLPGGPPVFLAVGRLVAEKNFELLIRAFARVRRERESRLLVLGEGPERARLEGLVRSLGLEEHVDMPGFVPNPYPYMAKASALVLSSLYEALPTVLIEGLALGVPVVATDCPYGPAEILEGGRWGILVPVGNEEALAQAMVEVLLKPPSEGERRVARESAIERFGLRKAVSEYWDIIQEITRNAS
ncbi:group 1 glycosyl transferase [Thermus thermophilus]|uniref:glycosyltransferase n=1 Tax=Thermus thermophilus TaxID=274 RepID=UPI00090B15B7|nr:glycosyltransferase [Thermus thermophilus]BAW01135.1 group 1 glycosyl transferase [Thermus thermophilus]BDB11802.1 glycosyl transferase [Thermus thermophilus]